MLVRIGTWRRLIGQGTRPLIWIWQNRSRVRYHKVAIAAVIIESLQTLDWHIYYTKEMWSTYGHEGQKNSNDTGRNSCIPTNHCIYTNGKKGFCLLSTSSTSRRSSENDNPDSKEHIWKIKTSHTTGTCKIRGYKLWRMVKQDRLSQAVLHHL